MVNGDGGELHRMEKLLGHLVKAIQVRLIALITPKSTDTVDNYPSLPMF